MKILVCGDSFAADWQIKYNAYPGWTNLLGQKYQITNRAQAGCSEYKIYLQLSNENLADYDCVIIAHTSPYRVPVEKHPLWHDDILHKNADLIYSDIKEKNDSKLDGITDFFENYFDIRYAEFVHKLIVKEQISHLGPTPTLHLGFYRCDVLDKLSNSFCFESIYRQNKGLINHMTKQGNQLLADVVDKWIVTQIQKL